MPILTDSNYDAYYVCQRHGVEDCPICTPRHCHICLKRFTEENLESTDVPGVCERCMKDDDEKCQR